MSAREELLRLADEMKYLSAAEWVDSGTVRKWQSELVTIANAMPAEGGEALARERTGTQWRAWSETLRRMIGQRTEKMHFAADVQANGDGVRIDNCRFIHERPCGYVHMQQYVDSSEADERHFNWHPVWSSKPPAAPANAGVVDEDGKSISVPMVVVALCKVISDKDAVIAALQAALSGRTGEAGSA